MSFEYSQEIINDLEKLLKAEEEYNVFIYADGNENIREIHARSILLRIRSQYFRTAFSEEGCFVKHQHEFLQQNPLEILGNCLPT
ncbi:BTB/POZ domain-containing protein [Rhizophagus irregularis DAOM 181602=DAOM 197198]|uniref:BTB domain-containing protein n=1 Tax=Rhizophagus irregularis (strain DAOM 181602 / DAOM 197198 / MUCL 43194) TaxID=747089 RepID=A0A2P4P8K8_RHIID|nr:hypothetical protein GLOIN_2v1786227 [Rhizophagus irregularis DAOM 181602=DAOM 197198]POG61714.1 hypothetical protein GLOIN_2v1786227 [Rhizophagus irregularis DAOM 181602=DAOM 197198]GBC18027.2 BTB/POZ domain-containing protein [Rhizophagus irregularis DAOM 181602=DAOM 197198]|eukprot:XP_025168580.1 hypothetical protein GLOIN_2v1786227 [Rhizophagus irregularis DAOM 181602=DAOM 197198]